MEELERILLERMARREIVETGRKLTEKRLVAGSWGNISCRTGGGLIAVTPSGLGYDKTRDEDIVLLDMDGRTVSGRRVPSSESRLHLAVYAACPQAGAVIHTHSIYASALAAMRREVPAVIEDIVQIIGGSVKCAEYALPGTQQLADNAVKALGGRKAALLASHGAVCWGANLEDALIVAEVLEKAAQIAVICSSCGGAVELSAEDAAVMHKFYEEHYSRRQLGRE